MVSNEIGYQTSDKGKKMPHYSNSKSSIQVWENYFKARNVKDTAAIRKLNTIENFKVYTPTGELIEGTDVHITFLDKCFTENNPKLTTKYMIANEFTNENREYINGSNRNTILPYL